MQRDDVLKILAKHGDELRQQFGVKSLALFGSVARGEAMETSDVDLLVEFELGCPNRLLSVDRFLDSRCQSRLSFA